jgi:EF hand
MRRANVTERVPPEDGAGPPFLSRAYNALIINKNMCMARLLLLTSRGIAAFPFPLRSEVMKARQSKIVAALAALFIGAYAWAPAIAGSYESGQHKGEKQEGQTQKAQPKYEGASLKEIPAEFKKADKDGDGYLNVSEYKALGKDEQAFKKADANADGRVDPNEWSKLAGG